MKYLRRLEVFKKVFKHPQRVMVFNTKMLGVLFFKRQLATGAQQKVGTEIQYSSLIERSTSAVKTSMNSTLKETRITALQLYVFDL